MQTHLSDGTNGLERTARIAVEHNRELERRCQFDVAQIGDRRNRTRERDPRHRVLSAADAKLSASRSRRCYPEAAVGARPCVASLGVRHVTRCVERRRIRNAHDLNACQRPATVDHTATNHACAREQERGFRLRRRDLNRGLAQLRVKRDELVIRVAEARDLERAVFFRDSLRDEHTTRLHASIGRSGIDHAKQ